MNSVSEFNKKVAAAVARSNVVDGGRWPAYPEEELELNRVIAELWLMANQCREKLSGVKVLLGTAVLFALAGFWIGVENDEGAFEAVFALVLFWSGIALVMLFTRTSVRSLDSIPQEFIGALLLTRRQLYWCGAVDSDSMEMRVRRELEAALRTKIFEHLLKLEQK